MNALTFKEKQNLLYCAEKIFDKWLMNTNPDLSEDFLKNEIERSQDYVTLCQKAIEDHKYTQIEYREILDSEGIPSTFHDGGVTVCVTPKDEKLWERFMKIVYQYRGKVDFFKVI